MSQLNITTVYLVTYRTTQAPQSVVRYIINAGNAMAAVACLKTNETTVQDSDIVSVAQAQNVPIAVNAYVAS